MNNYNQNPNQKPNGGFNNNKTPKRFNPYWFYALLGLTVLSFYIFNGGDDPIKVQWKDVYSKMLPDGDVAKILHLTNANRVEVRLKDGRIDKYRQEYSIAPNSTFSGAHFYFIPPPEWNPEITIMEAQGNILPSERVKPEYDEEKNYFGRVMDFLMLPIILLVFWLLIFRGMSRGGGGGIFSVGKSKAQLFDKDSDQKKITFSDVAGLEEAKVEIMEIVDFLKNPKKYTDLGGKIPKGILLVGPPGTGKTLLAKAVAGEANVPFFSMSGSDFVEMFVGVGASRVRDLFGRAKEKAPCIVFIDEIDAVGRARGKNAGFSGNDERENTLNQLLTEMDGFGTNSGVIVLAATNRADILDKALMRAGRFDRQIYVDLPEYKERLDIFKVHLQKLKLDPDFNIEFLARQTPGFSGADIANVCNEAALIAARKDRQTVGKQDFLDAIDRIIAGLEKKSKLITKEEKRAIAFHEAGHATVSWMLEHANPLLKVTIIPRGRSLGAAWYLPDERQITTTEQMMDEMAATLGGRAAEDLVFGKISTGALSDLEKVTKQAYAMAAYFGMSETIGNMSYYDSSGQSEYAFSKPYSEKTSETLDSEAKKFIDAAYSLALTVLNEHSDGLHTLAELLLEREVIFSEDLEQIFGKRKNNRLEELGLTGEAGNVAFPEQEQTAQ
ncbi:MAG: ATP-dependent zinc metalloprotease FtsH [Prevotellaceae bacterium]|jgi:cell division protease FtsH|nr:ATP-dependent zinc metalloprotease FtsH [Prevotellaceae bacterium]